MRAARKYRVSAQERLSHFFFFAQLVSAEVSLKTNVMASSLVDFGLVLGMLLFRFDNWRQHDANGREHAKFAKSLTSACRQRERDVSASHSWPLAAEMFHKAVCSAIR